MRLILTIILLLFSGSLKAPEARTVFIAHNVALRDETLLKAIIQVESGGNPFAVNWEEMAVGLLQIRQIMIDEVNRISTVKYCLTDAFDVEKSKEIFWKVQSYHNPTGDHYRGAVVWNGRSKTNKYWKKVKTQLNKL